MSALRKLLASSLPISLLAAMAAPGLLSAPPVGAATDTASLESPAELRLTALDALMKGDKQSAVELFQEAIRLAAQQFGSDSSFLGDLYYETGRLLADLDQFNQAEEYLGQAVKINPKNASARLALARLLDKRKKVRESLDQVREALMINQASPVARQKFVQILAKNSHSPSDIAIATSESLNIANIQKLTKEAFVRAAGESKGEPTVKPKNLTVPTVPKNIKAPPDETEASATANGAAKSASSKEEPATTSTTSEATAAGQPASSEKPAPKAGFSLFPLQDLSRRKQHEGEREQQEKAEAEKKAQEEKAEAEKKKVIESDMVQRLKEQVRQQEKALAAERAQREGRGRQSRASREESRAAKAAAATSQPKPEAKSGKAEAKPEAKGAPAKPQAAKAESKPAEPAKAESKPAEQPAPQAVPQQQQVMQPQMMMPQYMMQPVYQMPQVYTAPPKGKPGKGFVPPPPPVAPMYPGPMVMPQMIPAQQPKPAAPAKPKVDKPKPAPEAKPVDDKPPPMTSGENEDPGFLIDWAELPKKAAKKKTK